MSTLTTVARRMTPVGARTGAAVACLAVAAVAGSIVAPSANADAVFRLPNGRAHGEGVTIIKTGERVRVSPSLAANGAGRTAWVSGNVRVRAPGIDTREAGPNNGPRGEDEMPGSNGTSTAGAAATLSVGYVVGCQVDIGDLDAGLSAGITSGGLDGLGGSVSLPLAPGRVLYALVDKKQMEKPGNYFFGYQRTQLEIQGCGGYAQARSYVTLETTGNNHQKIQLWGKPFSVG